MESQCVEFKDLVRRQQKQWFEDLMVVMKGFIDPIPFESGTDDVEGGTELVAGLEDLLEIV